MNNSEKFKTFISKEKRVRWVFFVIFIIWALSGLIEIPLAQGYSFSELTPLRKVVVPILMVIGFGAYFCTLILVFVMLYFFLTNLSKYHR